MKARFISAKAQVINTDGTTVRAWTYVLKPAYRHRVTGETWSLDKIGADNLPGYLGKI